MPEAEQVDGTGLVQERSEVVQRGWIASRLGVRAHLALLVVLALLPAWGLAGVVALRLAASERTELTRNGQEAARNLAVAVEREMAVLRASLAVLATSPALAAGDLEVFHRQATRFHGAEGVQVALVDADGRLLLNTAMPYTATPVLRLPGGPPRLGLSQLERSPIGRPVVRLTERVSVGGLDRTAFLSILTDAVWFWSDDLRRAALPAQWVASVLDEHDRIMARFPHPEHFVGQSVHPSVLAVLPPRDGEGGGSQQGWIKALTRDDGPVYVAWQRVPGLPWTVLVGVPQDAVDGALMRSLAPALAAGLALMLALTVALMRWGGRRLVEPLRALEQAAAAVGAGGVPAGVPRSGVRELDAVGLALVEAAAERRAREAESARLSARLRAVLDHVPVGVALAEAPSGRIVLGNRRLTELLGHAVVGTPLGSGPEGAGMLRADGTLRPPEQHLLDRAIATGAPVQGEFRYRRPDGQVRWLRSLAAPIQDEMTGAEGAVVAVADIDAERRAADALRQSELRFRTLAEAMPHLVWATDALGRIDYVNPFFYRFTGLSPSVPEPPRIPMHPEDRPAAAEGWQRALDSGEPYSAQYRLRRADGTWRWFTAHARLARDLECDPGRWIGTAIDVTDLIETRQALEAQVAAEAAARQATLVAAEALLISETRFRRFAEASPDLLWILDRASGRLEYISPAYEEIWGERPPKGEGPAGEGLAPLLHRVHPDDLAQVSATLDQAREGEAVSLEYRIRHADNEFRWVRVMSFPIRDAADRITRIGGFARDISARRQADERQRLLIGELNHRVKNTLATVLAISRHSARGAAEGNDGPGFERFLTDFQARLMALARGHDLLTARTWQGAPLCEVASAALRPWQGEPGAEPRLHISGPEVMLTPKQVLGLALGLHELATNAAKHGALSTRHGQVQLSWRLGGSDLVELDWVESGGPAAVPPRHRGFGSRLLERGLPVELGPGASVDLNYGPEGVSARIQFRASQEGLGA